MRIEILQKADLASYKALMDECFGGSNELEKYEAYQKNAGYTIWIAKENGELVGSATQYAIELFTFSFQPCLMLFNVAVKKGKQKQGIAKALLEHIIMEAKKAGYHSISLTCLDDAFPAHKLYESVGFTKSASLKYNLTL